MAACEGPPVPKLGFELFHRSDAHLDIANQHVAGMTVDIIFPVETGLLSARQGTKSKINKKICRSTPFENCFSLFFEASVQVI
jgi:hypothetical protein